MDNDLCRVYDNIQGNSFSLKNANASHTTNIYSLRVDLFAAELYTVTFKDGDSTLSSQEVYENKTVSRPDDPTKQDYFFVGWKKGNDIYDFSSPVTESFDLIAQWTQDPAIAYQNDANSIVAKMNIDYSYDYSKTIDYYTKVTDATSLMTGDVVVIVNETKGKALSKTQNANNRGQEDVTISQNTISSISNNVQMLTLKNGKISNTFALDTGAGYLCAASSGNNYLKTQETLDNNGSWKITITEGNASIIAQGNYTRNQLRHNNSSSIFSCYASGQEAVQIYKAHYSSASYSNVKFVLGAGIDSTTIDGNYNYGIKITTQSGVETIYLKDQLANSSGNIKYITLSLGDVINTIGRKDDTITITPFIKIENDYYYCQTIENIKSYSVKELIKYYLDNEQDLEITSFHSQLVDLYVNVFGGTL